MYLDSELSAENYGLTLVQESDIPMSDKTSITLKLDDDTKIGMLFRIPYWAQGDLTISVNGEEVEYTVENGYARVERTWSNSDKIDVTIPLGLAAYNLQDGINTVCFKYGPALLAAKLGDENMTTTYTGMSVIIPETTTVEDDTLVLNDGITPKQVKDNPSEYFTNNGNLSFTFTANDEELEFVPYISLYNTRYGIYWKIAEAE